MKKRNLFLTLGLSLTLGVGVAAGLGASRVEAKEAHATPANGFYVLGDDIGGWSVTDESIAMTFSEKQGDNDVYVATLTDLPEYSKFQVVYYLDGNIQWNFAAQEGKVSTSNPAYPISKSDNNAQVSVAGSYTFYFTTNTLWYHVVPLNVPVWELKLNGVTAVEEMSYDAYDGVYANVNMTRGDVVSIEKDGVEQGIVVGAEGTNISSSLKVIVSGENQYIYVNRNTLAVWIDGYSNLHNFISGFLSDTISAGVCADPSQTSKEETNVWTYYSNWFNDMNANEKAAFQSEVTALNGDHSKYVASNELSEAAARYVLLANKYSLSFDGIIINSALIISSINQETNYYPIMIIVTSISLVAVASFFVIRRRKETN